MLCRIEMPANEQIYGRFYRYRMLHPQKGGQSGRAALALPAIALAAPDSTVLSNAVAVMVFEAWRQAGYSGGL